MNKIKKREKKEIKNECILYMNKKCKLLLFNIDKDRGFYEYYLHMQLKDDINGEDLTRYRKIIEKFPEFKPAYKYSNIKGCL